MTKFIKYFFVLIWFMYIICAGVHLFSKGFLLTRISQTKFTSCQNFNPVQCSGENETCSDIENVAGKMMKNVNISADFCLPKKSKVILLVIDALKYEFGLYNPELENPLPYQNRMPIFNELLNKYPENSKLMKFIADPPTTTMQRLKGMTTGSLPTFIDIGSNFATPEINEDNIIDQIVRNNLTAIFMGDGTWTELFPNRFKRKYSYPSFNIYDLDTIDNEIKKYLPNELEQKDWDVIIAHFLGVDHCGHKYGPLHNEMTRKLNEMDDVIRQIISKMDDETTLLVIGDHGMTITGDHGGDTDDEINSLLFAYSKTNKLVQFDDVAKLQQIDIVPTLSVILGVPMPYSNLGLINFNLLPDVPLSTLSRYQILLLHIWQNAKQIHNYFQNYAFSQKDVFNVDETEAIEHKFIVLSHRVNSIYTEPAFRNFAIDLQMHLSEVLLMYRQIWVNFDANLMSQGMLITFLLVFFCFMLIHNLKLIQIERMFHKNLISFIYASTSIVAFFSYSFYNLLGFTNALNSSLFFSSLYSILILIFLTLQNWPNIAENLNNLNKYRNLLCRLIYGIFVIIFFSNSFIIEENKILCYMLMGLVLYTLYEIKKNIKLNYFNNKTGKIKWANILKSIYLKYVFLGIITIILLRITHIYYKCREEHGNCTDFQNNNDSVNNNTNVNGKKSKTKNISLINVIVLALFVTLSRIYLRFCGNLTGYQYNVILARYGPTISVICTCGHYVLTQSLPAGVHQIHIDALAWIVYGSVIIQIMLLIISPLLIFVIKPFQNKNTINISSTSNNDNSNTTIPEIYRYIKRMYGKLTEKNNSKDEIPIVYGLQTAYSSILITFGIFLIIYFALLIGPKSSIGFLLNITITIIILFLNSVLRYESTKFLDACVQPHFITILTWILLAHYNFYATSHQPTISQINWNAAFIGRSAKYDNSNIISGILILSNTFSGIILYNLLYPIIILTPFCIYSLLPNLCSNSTQTNLENNSSLPNNNNRQQQHPNRPRVNANDKLKTSNNLEYRTVTLNKNENLIINDDVIENYNFDVGHGELIMYENDNLFFSSVFKTGVQFLILQGFRMFCSMLACTIHCRHLMVWKIFAPRFIYEGISTYLCCLFIPIGYLLLIRIHLSVSRLIDKINKSL